MLKNQLLAVDLWLSAGQLEHYFRLSGACYGCPGQMDNQNFKHWAKYAEDNRKLTGKTLGWAKALGTHQLPLVPWINSRPDNTTKPLRCILKVGEAPCWTT